MISNAVLATWSPRLLSVLRIVAALLFLQHGLAKLLHFPHVAMFDQLQLFSLLGLAGVIELVGSALLLIGLFTRPAAFIMSGEMAVAYFMAHGPRGFFPILNQGELALPALRSTVAVMADPPPRRCLAMCDLRNSGSPSPGLFGGHTVSLPPVQRHGRISKRLSPDSGHVPRDPRYPRPTLSARPSYCDALFEAF